MRKEATRLFPQELLNKSRHSTICLKKRWNIYIYFDRKCSIIARVARVLDSIERFASCHIVQELRSIQPLLQSPPPPHPPSPTPNNSRTPLVFGGPWSQWTLPQLPAQPHPPPSHGHPQPQTLARFLLPSSQLRKIPIIREFFMQFSFHSSLLFLEIQAGGQSTLATLAGHFFQVFIFFLQETKIKNQLNLSL